MTTADAVAAEPPTIVVGTDGSPSSLGALSWALAEAALRDATLDVIIAWELPETWAQGFNARWVDDAEYFARSAADHASAALELVLEGRDRPPWVHVHAVRGRAAQILIARSRHAHLLVVGSRGRGGFADLMLGSVSIAAAHHAHCPVCIVPSPGANERHATSGVVAVGSQA